MTSAVRAMSITDDHRLWYAVNDAARPAVVAYTFSSRRMWCQECSRERCEHVDMVSAHRRQQQRLMRGA